MHFQIFLIAFFVDFAQNPKIYDNVHIREYENGHLNKVLKRTHEIHLINKELAVIEARMLENRKK